MTDNPRMQTILELFHEARKQNQILLKLRIAVSTHTKDLQDISRSLCAYSPWKQGEYLVLTNPAEAAKQPLFWIGRVSLNPPQMLDLKPSFCYELYQVSKRDPDGEIIKDVNAYFNSIANDEQYRRYRPATLQEVAAIAKTLPKLRRPKGYNQV